PTGPHIPSENGDDGDDGDVDSGPNAFTLRGNQDVMAHAQEAKAIGNGRETTSPSPPSSPACGGCLRMDCEQCNPRKPAVPAGAGRWAGVVILTAGRMDGGIERSRVVDGMRGEGVADEDLWWAVGFLGIKREFQDDFAGEEVWRLP